jgi:lysyl-tRNA synthetase class 2
MQTTKNRSLAISENWRPTTTLSQWRARSKIISQIRDFFAERDVLEVDTPLLCRTTATDPHLDSLAVPFKNGTIGFLQTSPEFPMKRLLASGFESIYSMAKVFRADESGRYHNLEFTMLEWYRLGFNHHQLMDEMDAFLQSILKTNAAIRLSYRDIFLEKLSLDPFHTSITELKNATKKAALNVDDLGENIDTWLQLLMSHIIEPQLGNEQPHFIYDFPPSQAALAKIRQEGNYFVGERFEVYYRGIELANGYHELTDANEQRQRFESDNQKRKAINLPELPIDENLLSALHQGIPDCAGVALGVDRLVMLALNAQHINEVITFPFERV